MTPPPPDKQPAAVTLKIKEPDMKETQVQCADCFKWIDQDANHTCKQQIRRNQNRRLRCE